MITVQQLILGIEGKNGFPLDQRQQDAISYGDGPLLIAAGPGTGKTEVLAARALKLLCCDGVEPGSIMLTTFTTKAARNLEDRLAEGFTHLITQHPHLASLDTAEILVGTLHSLCGRILQDHRYAAYQNTRLLDELESKLLVYKDVATKLSSAEKSTLLNQFRYLFGGNPQFINNWQWATALSTVFNRLIEDQIDINAMRASGGPWALLHQAITRHEQALDALYACDFAHLLRHFHNYLGDNGFSAFLQGKQDEFSIHPPLTHVLVDEYQDTNPIQESIYLRLCDRPPHNLTVVGDDDQALYRFRGGNVDCMVGFEAVCRNRWGVTPRTMYLNDNHRSDDGIVEWCNDYIASFPVLNQPNSRIVGKPTLIPASGRTSAHPSVGLIRRARVNECALDFATLVRDLRDNGVIQDYSQCVLLLPSTRNTSQHAGPYLTALHAQGIPVYNPRSRDFQEQEEVAQILGAFIRIVDPNLDNLGNLFTNSRASQLAQAWVSAYDAIAPQYPELSQYVKDSGQAIQKKAADNIIEPNAPTIPYRILAHDPFVGYQREPERKSRISKMTRLFDSFCAIYGRYLRTDRYSDGELAQAWYNNFYYGFSGYIAQHGLDDDEDEEVICPASYFPIMTIHQSKGLEFDFVFVANLGRSVKESEAHVLETDLRPYRITQPLIQHTTNDAAWHDDIRRHFVAYSRAKYALVLIATDGQLRRTGAQTASFGSQGGGWVRHNVLRL